MDSIREPGECSRTPTPGIIIISDTLSDSHQQSGTVDEYSLVRSSSLVSTMGTVANTIKEDRDVDMTNDNLFVLDRFASADIDVQAELLDMADRHENQDGTRTFSQEDIFDPTAVLTSNIITQEPKQNEGAYKTLCFNCNGEHSLSQCKEPHNARKIAMNKSTYYNIKRAQHERYVRTTDKNGREKAVYRPGEVSPSLREALGIGRYDIPEWIYRMRRLGFIDGYPPGYLQQCMIDPRQNALLRFHSDDKTLDISPDPTEPQTLPEWQLDFTKIIAYPGFNYHDRKLRDLEGFRIPRFDDYLKYMERFYGVSKIQLVNENRSDRKNKRKMSMQSNGEKRRKQGEKEKNADICLVDSNGADKASSPCSSCSKISEGSMDQSASVQRISSLSLDVSCPPQPLFGSSISVEAGTFQVGMKTGRMKPSLDKFRVGIVPFEAKEECVKGRGFFAKLMAKLKEKRNAVNS